MSDGCVCLSDYDGDEAAFFVSQHRKARKPHTCFECGVAIAPKESYEAVTGKWDGDVRTYKFCALCSEISASLSCHGRSFGNMWEDIEENIFPYFSGACLDKLLTVEAKQHLSLKWMEWVDSRQ